MAAVILGIGRTSENGGERLEEAASLASRHAVVLILAFNPLAAPQGFDTPNRDQRRNGSTAW